MVNGRARGRGQVIDEVFHFNLAVFPYIISIFSIQISSFFNEINLKNDRLNDLKPNAQRKPKEHFKHLQNVSKPDLIQHQVIYILIFIKNNSKAFQSV
jgi:hypothetical protein